jgi:hypothetical protein
MDNLYAKPDPAQPPNPKKLMGDKKPPLHLLPLAGMIHQSLAHMDGDLKYGFENWNETPVEKLTYIGALLRHAELYKYGENYARDTNVHNLGAVMACCAILLDAELNGKLIDNTRHSKATCDLLHNAEAVVTALQDMQREREAKKNTFDTLVADARARTAGLNLDCTPRRETTVMPTWRTCRECTHYCTPAKGCKRGL